MYLPKHAQLINKEPLEKVEFWFNYWNTIYPVEGLQISFEDDGFVKDYAACADHKANKTRVNKNVFAKYGVAHGMCTTRHEHVHHLPKLYGYNSNHMLMFALVDNALAVAFAKMESEEKIRKALLDIHPSHQKQVGSYHRPENSITHYDIHEDEAVKRNVTTRMMVLLAKRLSRHCNDIENLLATAKKYADYLSESAPTKKAIRNLRRENDYLQGVNDSAFQGWQDSDTENQQLIARLEETQEQVAYLNSLNMKWQGAFVLLAIIATAMLVRVAP